MSDAVKHECGIAMVRLLKPLDYYREKYGDAFWGLNKLYLLMEKQHNRGQEGAGMATVKLNARPGEEYIFRERAEGTGAIQEIFATVKCIWGICVIVQPVVPVYLICILFCVVIIGEAGICHWQGILI